jgi:hypothetical protein
MELLTQAQTVEILTRWVCAAHAKEPRRRLITSTGIRARVFQGAGHVREQVTSVSDPSRGIQSAYTASRHIGRTQVILRIGSGSKGEALIAIHRSVLTNSNSRKYREHICGPRQLHRPTWSNASSSCHRVYRRSTQTPIIDGLTSAATPSPLAPKLASTRRLHQDQGQSYRRKLNALI